MQTIGSFLKEERVTKKYSLDKLERETRIKKVYLLALEEGNWGSLPDFAIVSGFVKCIANTLGIDEKKALAFLRRDYLPITQKSGAKKTVFSRSVWTPRKTTVLVVVVLVALSLIYLAFQYYFFYSPPKLEVNLEKSENDGEVIIKGETPHDASVSIDGVPIVVDEEGKFEYRLKTGKEGGQVVVISTSRSDKTTVVKKDIAPESP